MDYEIEDKNLKVLDIRLAIVDEKLSQDQNSELNKSKELNSFSIHIPVEDLDLNTQESPDKLGFKNLDEEILLQRENLDQNQQMEEEEKENQETIEKEQTKEDKEPLEKQEENKEEEIKEKSFEVQDRVEETSKETEIPLHQETSNYSQDFNSQPNTQPSTQNEEKIEKSKEEKFEFTQDKVVGECIEESDSENEEKETKIQQNEEKIEIVQNIKDQKTIKEDGPKINDEKKEEMDQEEKEEKKSPNVNVQYEIWSLESWKDEDLLPYNSPSSKSNEITMSPIVKKSLPKIRLRRTDIDPKEKRFSFTPLEKVEADERKLVQIEKILQDLNQTDDPEIEDKVVEFIEKKRKERSFSMEKENDDNVNIPTDHVDENNVKDDIDEYEMSSDESILSAYQEEVNRNYRRRAQSEIFQKNVPLQNQRSSLPLNTERKVPVEKKRKFVEKVLNDEELEERAFRWKVLYEKHLLLSKRKKPKLEVWFKAGNFGFK